MLSELAPREEVAEAWDDVEEEEGSSSTVKKEDNEDGRATDEGQIAKIPTEQAKILPTGP